MGEHLYQYRTRQVNCPWDFLPMFTGHQDSVDFPDSLHNEKFVLQNHLECISEKITESDSFYVRILRIYMYI
jgi:hypothetical protein